MGLVVGVFGAYVLYNIIRAAVRGGVSDALKDAGLWVWEDDEPLPRRLVRPYIAVLLAVAAIAFLVAGFIYVGVPAHSLPSFMGQVKGSNGHLVLRAVGCLVVGVGFAAAAWVAKSRLPKQPSEPAYSEDAPASRA